MCPAGRLEPANGEEQEHGATENWPRRVLAARRAGGKGIREAAKGQERKTSSVAWPTYLG